MAEALKAAQNRQVPNCLEQWEKVSIGASNGEYSEGD